jgi:hypothetical protein
MHSLDDDDRVMAREGRIAGRKTQAEIDQSIDVPQDCQKGTPLLHRYSQVCAIYSIERLLILDQSFQTVTRLAEKDCPRCGASWLMVFEEFAAF